MPHFRWIWPASMLASLLVAYEVGARRHVHGASQTFPHEPPAWTNQAFIEGLYSDLDLEDPDAVFAEIFRSLPEVVVVYPSEGYYYFAFHRRGLHVRGSILLDVVTRDQGKLEFGYIGDLEDHPGERYRSMPGRFKTYGSEHGLDLVRESAWEYAATYAGRTVRFTLHDPGHTAPRALGPGERYVSTCMDESGLRFHLLYHEPSSLLFWMLDERRFTPENLVVINEDLCRGARTRFVFLRDGESDRKLLLGVDRRESSYNTWYDGPFDQLPDTRVAAGEIDLQPLLAAYTGLAPERMDRFGRWIDEPGARVPVASYRLYESLDEFEEVPALVDGGASPVEILTHFTRGPGKTRRE